MKELKADHWSRIGRFRRKAMNISKMGSNARLMAGRLVADLSSDAAKVSSCPTDDVTAKADLDRV